MQTLFDYRCIYTLLFFHVSVSVCPLLVSCVLQFYSPASECENVKHSYSCINLPEFKET